MDNIFLLTTSTILLTSTVCLFLLTLKLVSRLLDTREYYICVELSLKDLKCNFLNPKPYKSILLEDRPYFRVLEEYELKIRDLNTSEFNNKNNPKKIFIV